MKRTPLKRKTPLRRFAGQRRQRFNARPHTDMRTGETFGSKAELHRWESLELMQRGGVIADLTPHPKIILIAANGRAPEIAWRVDASYTRDGATIYEDTKPRPATRHETILFKLWLHYGPGVLLIVDARGRELKRIVPVKVRQ